MQLVISGSAGTGKTTLAKRLASHLSIPYLPDYVDTVLHELGYHSPKELDDTTAITVRKEALVRKIQIEQDLEHFVADKGVIDYLAYWLLWTAPHASSSDNQFFYDTAVTHTQTSSQQVVLLNYGKYTLADNTVRLANRILQFRVHTQIRGLYEELHVDYKKYDYSFDCPMDNVVKNLELLALPSK